MSSIETGRSVSKNTITFLGVISLFGFFGFLYSLPGEADISSCESLIPQVMQISKDQKNLLRPEILGIFEQHKVSTSTPDRLECLGVAMLSNNTKQLIAYRAYKEYDKWWIAYEPAPNQ